jgi:hypothetical protein
MEEPGTATLNASPPVTSTDALSKLEHSLTTDSTATAETEEPGAATLNVSLLVTSMDVLFLLDVSLTTE